MIYFARSNACEPIGWSMIDVIRKIRVLLTPRDKYRLLGISILMGGAALAEVVGAGVLMPLVAIVVNTQLLEQNAYLNFFYRCSPFQSHTGFMVWSALLAAMVFLVKNIYMFLVIRIQAAFVYARQAEWSERLFRTLLQTDFSYHLQHSSAELNARLARVGLVCDGTLLPLMMLAGDALAVLALVAVMFWLIPGTVGIALGGLLLLGMLFYWPFRRINQRLSRAFVAYDRDVSDTRLDGLRGVKDVKAAGAEGFFARRYSGQSKRFAAVQCRLYQLGQLPRLALETLAVLLAMGIFAGMVLAEMPIGTIALIFGLLTAVMLRVLPALSRIHYNLMRLRQVGAAFDELYDDLTALRPEQDREAHSTMEFHLKQQLEIQNLTFGYPAKKPLFKEFNLLIPARSSVALVGQTGGGKTTLADLLLGLLRPQGGAILTDGADIHQGVAAWRRITAYVPQFIYLLNDTVAANVAFGVPRGEISLDRVWKALQLAQLEDTINALPDGLMTSIGDNGMKLSGGQRQRLGIARALYREPELLILDEATSALDQETESAIVEALENLHGRLTTIVIAHRLSTVEKCDMKVTI